MKLCLQCSQPVHAETADLCIKHQLLNDWRINTSVDNLGAFNFFRKVIPKAFKNFKYGVPKFHREIVWEVLKDNPAWKFYNRQIVIEIFRGSSKTTLVSKALALYVALFAIKKYIVLASKTGKSAEKNLRWIKTMLGNSLIVQLFGDLRPDRYNTRDLDVVAGKWTSTFIILKNGVTIECIGMGQHMRGSAEGEDVARIDLFIADDCESDENSKTPDRREDNKVWLFDTVLPSLDVDTGTIVFINTLTHTDSILANLMKPESNWRKISYPVSRIDEHGKEIPTWGEKFTLEIIAGIKNNYAISGRLSGFYKEYYNTIRSERGFDPDTFKFYEGRLFQDAGHNWLELKDKNNPNIKTVVPVFTYLGIDGAYSMKAGADYSALVAIAVSPTGAIYVLEIKRGRFSVFDRTTANGSTTGFIDEAWRLHEKYNFSSIAFGVEGQQLGYFTQLKDKFRSQCRIIAHANQGNKADMLFDFLAPKYEAGLVYHRHNMADLWRELVSLGDTTDDIIDGLQMAIRYAKIPKGLEYNPLWGAMEEGEGWDGAIQVARRVKNWMCL